MDRSLQKEGNFHSPYLEEWTWTDHFKLLLKRCNGPSLSIPWEIDMNRSFKKKVIFSFHTIRNGHGQIFSDFQKGVMVCPCPYPRNGHGQIITEGR